MPVARLYAYRIVPGVQNIATINAATPIKNWTLQSDQNYVFRWMPPDDPPAEAEDPRTFREPVSGKQADFGLRTHGYLQAQWAFKYWTFGQYAYVRSQFFSGGVKYAPVSVLSYDDNVAQYVSCIMYDPKYTGGLVRQVGGYGVVVQFDAGEAIVA